MHFNHLRTLTVGLCALCAVPSLADDDFGIWSSVSAEKDFNKRFSVEAGVDFRAERKLENAARWGASVGATYKLFKFVRLGASYAFIYDRNPLEEKLNYNDEGEWRGYNVDGDYHRSKHRGNFDVVFKHKVGRFSFSLRERYQYTHHMATDCTRLRLRDKVPGGYSGDNVYTVADGTQWIIDKVATDRKHSKNAHMFRSRLEVEYDIKGVPLTPSVSYEFYNNLQSAFSTDKTRLCVGTKWKINKQHSLSLGYIYQNGTDDDSFSDIHVIDVGYKFKF